MRYSKTRHIRKNSRLANARLDFFLVSNSFINHRTILALSKNLIYLLFFSVGLQKEVILSSAET